MQPFRGVLQKNDTLYIVLFETHNSFNEDICIYMLHIVINLYLNVQQI